jgi:hypothetical protein
MSTFLFTAPTTELQAVNLMLESIGEAPVSTLSSSGLGDVTLAKDILGSANREVQSKGWSWNTDYQYQMALDGDNKIPVAPNVLEIDTDGGDSYVDVVLRGGFLWDRANKTFVFDRAVKCSITWLLEFESIPQPARHYISVVAARRFAKAALGSEEASRLTAEDEISAWSSLHNMEARTGDANMLNDNYSASQVLDRDPNSFWILG